MLETIEDKVDFNSNLSLTNTILLLIIVDFSYFVPNFSKIILTDASNILDFMLCTILWVYRKNY